MKWLLPITLLVLMLAPRAQAQFSITETCNNNVAGSSSTYSITCTFGAPLTVNQFVIGVVSCDGSLSTANTVGLSDGSPSNIFTQVNTPNAASITENEAIFYYPVTQANTVITATWTQSCSHTIMVIAREYSGVHSVDQFPAPAVGTTATTFTSATTSTTTQASEVLIGIGWSYGISSNPLVVGSGYSNLVQVNVSPYYAVAMEDQTVASTGTYNATMTDKTGATQIQWTMAILTASAYQPPIISPVNATVNENAQTTFTALGGPGTFSCSGCAGSVGSSTGVYSAPATVAVQQSVGGYQLLPNNHIYNTNISAAGLCTVPACGQTSATFMANISTAPIQISYSKPFNYINNATPTTSQLFLYTPGNNGTFYVAAFPGILVESGWYGMRSVDGTDHHVIEVNTDTGVITELYQYYGLGNWSGCLTCSAQSGLQYSAGTYDLNLANGTTDAAGMLLTPLLLRKQEFEHALNTGGSINHAARMTMGNSYIHPAFLWPGTNYANAGSGYNFYGERFRLKSAFNITGFSAGAQLILKQWQNYGIFLADGGTNWQADIAYDAWTPAEIGYFNEINNAAIATSNWEVVDDSAYEVTSTSGQTNQGQETVCFTQTATSAQACANVTLVGATVNFLKDEINIMAGTPQQSIPYNIEGNANTAVSCTMSPTVGSLNSSTCAYTPPATASTEASTVVTITSSADANASATMTINVWPNTVAYALPSYPSGNDYTDTFSHVWKSGAAIGVTNQPKTLGCCYNNYYGSYTGGPTNENLWWYVLSSSAALNDYHIDWLVPQGTYTVAFNSLATYALGNLITFVSQGTPAASNVDFTSAVGRYGPYVNSFNLTVGSNNQLNFDVMVMNANGGFNQMSSFSVTQTGGTPSTNAAFGGTAKFGGTAVF